MAHEALKYVLNKLAEEKQAYDVAGMAKKIKPYGDAMQTASAAWRLIPGIAGGAFVLKTIITKLQNDTRRKAIIEDLALADPILKNVEKGQLVEWYATVYHYAPKMSLDKNTVREVLQGFARFGKVDIQTLKLLAETEKALMDQVKSEASSGWKSVLR